MTAELRLAGLRRVVAAVPDPELPQLTIEDLGVLRDVTLDPHGHVEVVITPTYTGCPAMETIRADVLTALAAHGQADASVRTVLAPAWTTEWISPAGRRKLRESGIAPPHRRTPGAAVALSLSVRCPRCGSAATSEVSRFGSTACRSLWRCTDCLEPFDSVKAI